MESTSTDSKCCQDCSRGDEPADPCCLDLEELPDAPGPQVFPEVPPATVSDLPADFSPAPLPADLYCQIRTWSGPIRGPDSPTSSRAVLGIWRL